MKALASPPWTSVRRGRIAAAAAIIISLTGLATNLVISAELSVESFEPHLTAIGVGFGLLSWLVLPREPANQVVWVYLLVAVLAAVYVGAQAIAGIGLRAEGIAVTSAAIAELSPSELNPVTATAAMVGGFVVSASIFWLLSLGVLMFPDGRLPSHRWRWVAWLAIASAVVTGVMIAVFQWPGSDITYGALDGGEYDDIITAPLLGLVAATMLSFVGLLFRFRRISSVERQQIRWILFGSALVVPALGFGVTFSDPGDIAVAIIVLVALLVYMACFFVAMTRYRLYDIDVVISRSIVFGVVAVFITAVYALLVVGVGSWVGAGTSSLPLSIGATALVAVVFEPVRERIQRFANRLVYGARATPYQVLADLTGRLASAESTEGLLERMVQRLSEGTGAARAVLRLEGEEHSTSVWPPDAGDLPSGDEFTVPIETADMRLGSVSVLKSRGEALTPTEQGLVEDLAGSAGMVLNKVRLDADLAARAEELRASRRRLVDAQAEERRRLERDLHDGAQQQVVALKVKLGLAERFAVQEGSARAAELIRQMASDAQEALEEIRSLGKGIFPPLLESDGLQTAVNAGAANAPIPVIVAANDVRRQSPEIEAAAYFCITEAITNAIKYSGSERIDVELTDADGGLEFVVSDRGKGFDPADHEAGSGLVGMRDRLEALGGSLEVTSAPGAGTRITGFVPG